MRLIYSFKDHDLFNEIEQDRHDLFMKNTLMHLIAGSVTASLLLWFYWQYATINGRIIWVSANTVLVAIVITTYSIYWKHKTLLNLKQWYVIKLVSALLWGLVWGSAPFIFLNTSDLLLVAVLLVLCLSICSSPISAMAYYLYVYYVFMLPILIGVSIGLRAFIADEWIIFLLFFGVAFIMYARDLHKTLIEGVVVKLEKVAAYAKAEEANATKNRFLAAVSHDLRQPLQAIFLSLDSIKSTHQLTEADTTSGHTSDLPNFSAVDIIENSAHNLSYLLDSLMEVSHLENQGIHFKRITLNIKHILDKLANEYTLLAENKNLDVEYDAEPALVYGDNLLLSRIFSNLLSNALRYTNEGSIGIKAYVQDNKYHVIISDTGEGIAENEQDKVFTEFYRVEKTSYEKGLGLGLSIVKKLIDTMDIPMRMDSALGQGTRFALTLPISNDSLPVINATSNICQLNQLKVLLVDDDAQILSSLSQLLQNWGADVRTATNLQGAKDYTINSAKPWLPEFIITDYKLPLGETGLDIIEVLTQDKPIPALIITGNVDIQSLKEKTTAANVHIMQKPVKPASLRMLVNKRAANKDT